MDTLHNLINTISGFVWGTPLIILLVGSGLYLTIRLKFIQLRGLKHSLELIKGKYKSPDDQGQITPFQALCAALSGTIGTGNIAGVATAIASGGPGAVFWMWMTALVGMGLKYASCLLAIKYREIYPDGSIRGGPMYYIEHGLGEKFKPLAMFFAFCTALATLGMGNMVQSNSVADAIRSIIIFQDGNQEFLLRLAIGLLLAFLTALVVLGGIKRIGQVASLLVPIMTIAYVGGALVILFSNPGKIFPALQLIIRHAFTPTAAAGGFLGSTVLLTIRMGVARGIFSNESGLGTAPMIHAAARTHEPVHEGLVAMIGPFVDTIIICTMTALVIIASGLWKSGLNGAPLTAGAFEHFLSGTGHFIVSLGLCLFAYSTLVSWYYYGEKGVEYLLGHRLIKPYKWIYIAVIPLGAVAKLKMVWGFSDIANGMMAVPNLIALLSLSNLVYAYTQNYFDKYKKKT